MKRLMTLVAAAMLSLALLATPALAGPTYTEGYFYYTVADESVTITGYFGRESEVRVPSSIAGYPVNSIGSGAFAGSTVSTIYLPDTVSYVAEGATGTARVVFGDGGEIEVPDFDDAETIENPVNPNGSWVEYQGKRYYRIGAAYAVGWLTLGDDIYWLGPGGYVKTGVIEVDGAYYYAGDDGTILRDYMLEAGGTYYYLGEDGKLVTGGWISHDGAAYYVDKDWSVAFDRWVRYGGKWYYFDEDGALAMNAWKEYDGAYYYFGADAQLVAGDWRKISGVWFYFRSDGRLAVDVWLQFDGGWYYFGSDGQIVSDMWLNVGDDWYYINPSGRLVIDDWAEYGGSWYHFNAAGVCDYVWSEE